MVFQLFRIEFNEASFFSSVQDNAPSIIRLSDSSLSSDVLISFRLTNNQIADDQITLWSLSLSFWFQPGVDIPPSVPPKVDWDDIWSRACLFLNNINKRHLVFAWCNAAHDLCKLCVNDEDKNTMTDSMEVNRAHTRWLTHECSPHEFFLLQRHTLAQLLLLLLCNARLLGVKAGNKKARKGKPKKLDWKKPARLSIARPSTRLTKTRQSKPTTN